ncbi:diacylglycerol/lipid kinase family protein [Clostridium fallax]|uniref:Lipid kinase, YegS/Rv2252/BmrU family n=1 Tax=Clostridium fallax TaxID=1533 RepID=A0A1M4WFF4_9CLOT|nr:diacylglycerol kinase family protein [Clostridium fallax]SHE79682.1 lipid kinase, YegS/Rv2252/BmrU family [Clostridium fallax]SQB04932.1 diacylglycerol kinase [Clostridium fallax]
MNHLFIINPMAGKGKTLKYVENIKEIFNERDEKYIIEITKYKGHATEIVKEYTKKSQYRVYSIGGDGTLNEILNGIINSNSSLAIIPAGSGNDFIRTIVKNLDDDNILFNTINGEDKIIDLAKVNTRFFVNISSIGFDANVVNNSKFYKKKKFISGPMAYFISIITTIFKFKPINIEIKIDDKLIKDRILLLAVANGKYYGGGIPIAPFAKIDDGLFEIYLIKQVSIFKLLKSLKKVIKGEHTYSVEEIDYLKGKSILVSSKEKLIVNIDGEIVESNELNFKIISKGLKIVKPLRGEAI